MGCQAGLRGVLIPGYVVPSPGASSPRHSFPPQLQWEGKGGAGAAGLSCGRPEPEAPAAAERDLAARAEFLSPLFLPALYDAQPA